MNQALLPPWQRLKERNRCKVIFGRPARASPFSHYTRKKRKKQQQGKELADRGLGHNLCLFYLITRGCVYVQPITLIRLSQTDDVSNWKAWKALEQPASHRNQPYFYLPRLAPKWRGSEEVWGGSALELVFLEKEQRSFLG